MSALKPKTKDAGGKKNQEAQLRAQGSNGRPNRSRTPTPGALSVEVDLTLKDVPPHRAFEPIRRIGGANGWYYANWLWRLRGIIDLLVGGTGLRRGRRDAENLRAGDALDCWRVEVFEPDRRLGLALEMKLPGRGWLDFEVLEQGPDSTIKLTALYDPRGSLGRVYWFLSCPIHRVLFTGLLRGIASRCNSTDAGHQGGGSSQDL